MADLNTMKLWCGDRPGERCMWRLVSCAGNVASNGEPLDGELTIAAEGMNKEMTLPVEEFLANFYRTSLYRKV